MMTLPLTNGRILNVQATTISVVDFTDTPEVCRILLTNGRDYYIADSVADVVSAIDAALV